VRRLTAFRHRGHWKEGAYTLGRERGEEEEEGRDEDEVTTAVAAASIDEEEAVMDTAAAAKDDDAAALELESLVRVVLDLESVAGGEGEGSFTDAVCSVFCFLLAGMTSVEMDVEYMLFVCSSVAAARFFFSLFTCCVSATSEDAALTAGTEGVGVGALPEQRKSSSSSETMTVD
jgi:hypothetical protein